MAHPFPLATVFTGGMRRDMDRTQLPPGSVWNLVDFIPDELQAAASGRGGWTYAGPTLSGSNYIVSVGYHPDTQKVVTVDGHGVLWDVAVGTSIANPFLGTQQPAYHRGYLVWGVPGGTGHVVYYKSDGTTGNFASSPSGWYPAVYKDHLLLAKSDANTNRLWFSAAGDPTTWDLNFGWWDTSGAITGLATLTNSILLFHGDSTERLRGTTPPPGSDMVLEPFLPNVGCLDHRSVAYWQGNVIFASSQGIYMTNGVSSVDLTAEAGMKTYWQSIMSNASISAANFGGGVYRDHYILSVSYNNGGANVLVDCLCVSLTNRTMWRFTNLRGNSFVNVTNASKELLYMGQKSAGRVIELSSLWNPSASVKQDGDGTNPTPIIETGAFRGYDRLHRRWIESYGLQKWRYAYLDYDLRDSASDNPTITLSYATTPGGAYTTATGGSIPETTDYSRVKRYLNPTLGGATRSDMLELKLAVNGPYAAAKVYALECDFSPIDIGRLK